MKDIEQRKSKLLPSIRNWQFCFRTNPATINEDLMLKDLQKSAEMIEEQGSIIDVLTQARDLKMQEIERLKEKLEIATKDIKEAIKLIDDLDWSQGVDSINETLRKLSNDK